MPHFQIMFLINHHIKGINWNKLNHPLINNTTLPPIKAHSSEGKYKREHQPI